MLRPIHLPITALACSLPLAFIQPALAQTLSTKDAWDVLASFIAGTGGSLTSAGLRREGDALVAPGVVLSAGDMLSLTFDQIRLEQRGDDVAVIPSPRFNAVSTLGLPGERREYAIDHDGSLILSASVERAELALDFGRLAMIKTLATRQGEALNEAFDMTLTGLAGRLGLTLQEPFGFRGDLSATELVYDLTMTGHPIPLTQTSRSRTQALTISLSADGLRDFEQEPGWVSRAFEQGLDARLRFTQGLSENFVDQDLGGTRTVLNATVAATDGEVTLTDGMLNIEMQGETFDVATQMMGVEGSVSMARMGVAMEMPLIIIDDDRPFRIGMMLDGMSVSEPLLAMLGASIFASDVASVALDVQGNGRWLVEITDNPETGDVPFDFSSIDLNRLVARIGDSNLTGEGSFAFTPGTFGTTGEGVPEGEGAFNFDLRGGDALLGRLAAAGLIPPDQQFMARMMMSALGRPVGEDHLRSEVAINPGGQLTVNGLPLPF